MEFLFTDWLGTPAWFWLVFLGLVIALTAFDLGVLHKENKEMGIAESLKLSALYIGIALAFGAWIWVEKGGDAGLQYYTGFFIEKALSIDNIFVISLIFATFAIPARYQYRALLWGIVAVIVLRGLMIAGGAALVAEYGWLLYVFAAFLIFTGIRMLFASDKPMDVAGNPVVRWLSRRMPITADLHGEKFFVRVPDAKTGRSCWRRRRCSLRSSSSTSPIWCSRSTACPRSSRSRPTPSSSIPRTSWRSSACARSISRSRRWCIDSTI